MKKLSGIITPTISPFRGDKIDEVAIEKLMNHLHKIGISGIFPMGSTGSSPFVTNSKHKRILDIFSKFRRSDDFFMPGVGKNSIEDTIEISKYAEELSSDAIVIVTPYYLKVDQRSIYSYFEEIIRKIDLPVVLYNIPQLTGNSIMPETVLSLSKNYSNVVGLKDSSGNLSLFQDYILQFPKYLSVFQGQDELLLSSLVTGAAGGVCGSTNFVDLAVKVFKSFKEGEMSQAIKLQKSLSKLKNNLNGRLFPQVYSFLFYKLILREDFTGVTRMLVSLSKEDMNEIYEDISKMLIQTSGPIEPKQ